MRKRTDVSKRLLKNKHRKMGTGAFPFLRATFYRWVERWPEVCPGLPRETRTCCLRSAICTSRTSVCGATRNSGWSGASTTSTTPASCPLPAISSGLPPASYWQPEAADLDVSADRVCALLLKGYRAGLRAEGKPILLSDGRHPALVTLTRDTQEDPKTFWKKKLDPKDNPHIDAGELPKGLEHMFRASFQPGAHLAFREQKSPGGLGSLGRRRFTAVETLKNSVRDAREAKALVPSAQYWHAGQDHMPSQTATLLQHAVRVPDPHFQVHDEWLIRQFAPDVAKIEMPENARDKRLALAPDLLQLMGQETANIHLGSRSRNVLENLLNGLDHDERWFPTATERMAACTREDHAEWAKQKRIEGSVRFLVSG